MRKHSDIQMNFLQELLKSKFPKLDISRQYLSDIIRDNNITRKRATFKHFPKTYRGNVRNEQQELKEFFDVINKFKLEDIISIDETSVSTSLTHNYCRAFLGDRCIKKTTNNEFLELPKLPNKLKILTFSSNRIKKLPTFPLSLKKIHINNEKPGILIDIKKQSYECKKKFDYFT